MDMNLSDLAVLRDLLASSPFHALMPVQIASVDRDEEALVLKLAFAPQFERTPGTRRHHGGVIATLVDIAGAFAMVMSVGRNVPTTSLHVDYLRPPTAGSDLTAHARVRKAGRSVGVADVEVIDSQGRVVALGRVCTSTLPAE